MAGGNRFVFNPFPDLMLTRDDRARLTDVANKLVMAKLLEYQEHLKNHKLVDLSRWNKYKKDGSTMMYVERKKSNPESRLPALLMVGPLPGSLEENMFGLVSPTIESMRIKSSYLKDFNAAAILATIMEPTEEEPFRSIVVKWIEIDIPGASIGIVRNRDYIYLESTGIMQLDNGDRVGYHLMHSVSFAQAQDLPNRVRGNMSFCGIFHQEAPGKTDCRGTGIMDPGGDMIHILGIMGMAQATMAGLKYSYCGHMKKLTWLLEQKHAEAREQDTPAFSPECVTCKKEVKGRWIDEYGKSNNTCNLCFGTVCTSCKIFKKLSFIASDLKLVQRKIKFCTRCLIEANRMDTVEAARVQFVHKHVMTPSIYDYWERYSNKSALLDSTMDTKRG
ncbi:unnamed protein product [Peronospora belbahrii]|uniref:FYVE-type domain-containing protein n=1 Tax=Peronospora belbahrii TaxID=622444 RepID=A0AAU9LEU5_9STRA|nr:unnamed protein product [Peronospora belbahrii]